MRHLQGLVSFVEAAASGSYTAAAQRLDLTPAAVSKNVMRLEQQVGVRLFNRTTRRLTLTVEGRDFAERAREALRGLDEAVSTVSRAGGHVAGRVRISVGVGLGRQHVMPLARTLTEQHPELEIDVSLDNRPVDLVAEGFDIGVRGGHIHDSSLVARHLAQLPVVLVAAPDYLSERGIPTSLESLANHRLIAVRNSAGQLSPWRFRAGPSRSERAKRIVEWAPNARLFTSDPDAPVDLALDGAGICQTGLWHVVDHLRAGRLKVLLAGEHDPGEREIVLHFPHRQFLSARVRTVVDALLAHFAAARDLHLTPADLPSAWQANPAPTNRAAPAPRRNARKRQTTAAKKP